MRLLDDADSVAFYRDENQYRTQRLKIIKNSLISFYSFLYTKPDLPILCCMFLFIHIFITLEREIVLLEMGVLGGIQNCFDKNGWVGDGS